MKWPPLIESAGLPRWVVARDVLATLLAWGVLLYLIRDMAWMVLYWTMAILGVELPARWAPGELWRDTMPFLKVVALLVVWLVVFAVARWQLLTSRRRVEDQPAPLDPARQAVAFGLPGEALEQLRHSSSTTVDGLDPISGRWNAGSKVSVDTPATADGSHAPR
ncbi:MAG: hypothetical protein J7507_08250 [Pseudoxanthomonas sp.]|nr:hypothetical protein [Pseudoxanthomonas sp.]